MADHKHRKTILFSAWLLAGGMILAGSVPSFASRNGDAALLVQMPEAGQAPYGFDMPPKRQEAPDTSVLPSNQPLGPEELQRTEALIPLLEGKQEFWAIGEFVHLGKPAVPVLMKALTMPGPRIRYNAIETLWLIKDPSAVPALLKVAQEPNEMPRIREHALRIAVRLDPAQTPPAIALMAKDSESAIRKIAAFEARYVREKAVIPVLIGLITDEERFVAISAVQSLWLLTRHPSEMHNWDDSTKEERAEWAKEWVEWWNQDREPFQFPEPRQPRQALPQN